ncbi:4-amino-4-deoxychorismate lyase [Pararhizobium capsulatum DSM 1112]|uniref:Probable branched-chain-amino-acid aminotransferase n=1 Tax=Pararhizobium capsulatum DSM 1112 TaxID=1121113 RepID=A0ABU0BUA1_9HYPH|nr:aminotransferase class IV family protein [Pararhizobium capsulatum]MDQ0321823.1 4-amino-4-deoxychorismate lyase [Pararhizobium capsulatum DSM 1112]
MTDFSLIETMRFEPGTGIVRQRLHMARLTRSAARLGFPGAINAPEKLAEILKDQQQALRVRLTLSAKGEIAITTAPFVPLADNMVWHVRIAHQRLQSTDPLLRYKTSRRAAYEAARAEYPPAEADEVLLLNEKAEVCEGTITSLFLDDGSGVLKVPPISSGLLAGVLRTQFICERRARVQRLTLEDLKIGRVFMGNSLRGLIACTLEE